MKNTRLAALIASGSVLAAAGGSLGAYAISGSSEQAPATTTTISLANGTTGPTGPAGPAGEPGAPGKPGAEGCPTGSTFGAVVINHPGGHVEIWTCIKNGG
jgi:hypothetical protein